MMHPEQQYLNILRQILAEGTPRMDRTGVGTRALVGSAMRFDLSDGTIPLFTTKKVFWKTAAKEMLWFLTGSTNIRPLLEQDVHIWSEWPHKAYRERTGSDASLEEFERLVLADEEFAEAHGDLGPVYGAGWRRWPDGRGGTIDQVADCILKLRENPTSRQNLFHAWNVAEIKNMALPPCHLTYQWLSDGERVNLVLFQRSADIVKGVPFNIFGACMLLAMMAQQSGLKPGVLQWYGGDVHLYSNHEAAARLQLEREPRAFPRFELLRHPDSIDGYRLEDFRVSGYDPHPFIKTEVAV